MDFSEPYTRPWAEFSFVAFDLETSGAYPLGSDIIEFGAVKWQAGRETDTYQTLLKPREPLTAFNMSIHGITNEQVKDAPVMRDKISEIRQFMEGSILMAHHAPFDMGFMAVEFERYNVSFPKDPVICTSLLARKMVPESPNHKLQTLIKVLDLVGGQAHRGLDDARACLQLGLICMGRLGSQAILKDVYDKVEKDLSWSNFLVLQSGNSKIEMTVRALENHKDLDLIYEGGSIKGTRRISPVGIVRNPDGDYIQATCHIDRASKRFYVDKIKDIQMVF
jgi:DNA polymerase-3 subunit epsilon